MSTQTERRRCVAKMRREIAEEGRLSARRYGMAQRRRIVEAMCAADGLPPPVWPRLVARRRTGPIDVVPIRAAWEEAQRERHRRHDAQGLALEDHGRSISCRRCGAALMEVPNGIIGITPSAIRVMHMQATGCR